MSNMALSSINLRRYLSLFSLIIATLKKSESAEKNSHSHSTEPLLHGLILPPGNLSSAEQGNLNNVTKSPSSNNIHLAPPPINCFARCVVSCVSSHDVNEITRCENDCESYGREALCRDNEHRILPGCWPICKDLGPASPTEFQTSRDFAPKNFTAVYNTEFKIDAKWEPVAGAKLYFVQIENDDNAKKLHLATERASFINLSMSPKDYICKSLELRISAANKAGLSPPSKYILERPKPILSSKLKMDSLTAEKEPFVFEDYKANATISIGLQFELKNWPFGIEDLEVKPIFHMISCEVPDLENAIPEPEFKMSKNPAVLIAKTSADLMYRRCRFIYAVGEVRSKKCDQSYSLAPTNSDYSDVIINCHTVKNSDCKEVKPATPPVCGRVKNFNFEVIRFENENSNDNATVKIKFDPTTLRDKPLYFVAIYGHALEFSEPEKKILLGVNLTDIIGKASNCEQFGKDGSCVRILGENWIVIHNLNSSTVYGVSVCAIFDPNNLNFPLIGKDQRFLVQQLFFKPPEDGFAGVGVLATILTIFVLVLAVFAMTFWLRQQKKSKKNKRRKLDAFQSDSQHFDRYVELPKKPDSWELDRRDLTIYYDKKLGAGAFGTVYLGKISRSFNRNGPPNLNTQHSMVAVKMLPEYADKISKSDFLREISLMKNLGYHERLVNMLACCTQSEPYCLIVEQCSDGDLLHFLRERCKYMLELNEAKIDYAEPSCEADFNRDMVMSLKQLLMFMVQISYGLEYLAQKGFVHRDVAARNILVHEKRYAKIGDFGLCRYIYADSCNYKGKGGRLPVKWMSPEAIRHYEFTSSSDVWSFGVLMFEIITLGGTPYPGIQPNDLLAYLDNGNRILQPDNCPNEIYKIMSSCWQYDPRRRHEFSVIRQQLALQLEAISDEYSYLKLDAQKDYYNVSYNERKEQEIGEDNDAQN